MRELLVDFECKRLLALSEAVVAGSAGVTVVLEGPENVLSKESVGNSIERTEVSSKTYEKANSQ